MNEISKENIMNEINHENNMAEIDNKIKHKVDHKIRTAADTVLRCLNVHRELVFQCVLALVLFILYTYRLSEIGQPILFNDEIGYWSNSAFFLGIDWTSVTGRINYYSYGYSLLLVPIRLLSALFGWGWSTLYHAAVVMNAGFLVASYVLAIGLAKRYLPEMNRYVRIAACFAVFTYSADIVYAHITWTECTLTFFFWIFLYVMSRVTDKPGVGNHTAFALVSFYLYTVHQRALGIVVTSVIIVLYMRLLRRNRVRDVAAFLGTMYLYSLVHAIIKGNLQNVNYLGGEPTDLRGLLGYAFTGRAAVVLIAGIILMIFLWLIDRRKTKTIVALVVIGFAAISVLLYYRNINPQSIETAVDAAEGTVPNRLSVNDFSGQWGVLKNIFSVNGLIRLGISIAGKWFYLAAASGLVVCWGIYGLFKNAVLLFGENISLMVGVHNRRNRRGAANTEADSAVSVGITPAAKTPDNTITGVSQLISTTSGGVTLHDTICTDRIWLFGVLLAWFSTFMISAIYKEGLYKNDDLFNGRYVEFTIGFLLLYSLNCLINDRKWLRTAAVSVILYIGAGYLCQYAVDELQRTEFELAHCVMFGRVFWNYEVPYGKVEAISRYILPLGAAFLVVLKPLRERFSKVAAARAILALMIPIAAWSYLGERIVNVYVVVRNEKQSEPFVQFADRIRTLGSDENIYYILDYANERNVGALQFMLQDRPVTVTWLSEVSFTEDAFYIIRRNCWDLPEVAENCETVMEFRGYRLVINKNQHLAERWKPYKR